MNGSTRRVGACTHAASSTRNRVRASTHPTYGNVTALAAVLCASALWAPAAEPASVPQQQQAQQQVRSMARELVGGVLAIQLQQLHENGLDALPVYAEIQELQKHLDVLVDREMTQVMEILAKAEAAPAGQRSQALLDARDKSRRIVVALLVERQNLLRRLKIAELAAEVRRLIELQTTLLTKTESLPEQPLPRREQATLTAIEDQRDIAALYAQLKQTLLEVSHWPGELGSEAAEGLRLLETGRVDAEIQNAENSLRSSQFPEAAVSQRAVIRGLEALLVQVKKLQGVVEADRKTAEDAIQRVIEQQQQLRDATQQTNLAQPEADKLVTHQAEIRKQIAQLREDSQAAPETRQKLQQAEKAAEEAAAKLFDQKQDEAVAEQENVLKGLREAAAAAHTEQPPAAPDVKTEQLAQAVKDLQQARQDLQQIRKDQQQASAAAPARPAAARRQEQQVAEQLGRVPEKRQLPAAVKSKVGEAQQAAHEAAAKMDHPPAERQDATRQAEQAIDRALSEAESALADAARQQLAGQPQLTPLAQQQAQQVREVRQAVEKKLAERLDSVGQKLERLAQAEDKVAEASAQQQRAAGRPEAAQARQLAHKIARALELQDQADQAVETAKPNAPAERAAAVVKQHEVARAAEELAHEAPPHDDPLTKALSAAQKAADHAAQQLAEKNQADAKPQRTAAHKALEQARQLAAAAARKAAQAPAGKPDAQAQRQVSHTAAEAQRLAQPDAADAAQTLTQAGQRSNEAVQHSDAGKQQPASEAQQSTAALLDRAAEQLARAREDLGRQAGEPFQREAENARQLSRQAIPADPSATAALQAAENAARQAVAQAPATPVGAAAADQRIQQAMEQAAASLAAREQQILGAAQTAANAPPPGQGAAAPVPPGNAQKTARMPTPSSQPSLQGRTPDGDSRAATSAGAAGAPADHHLTDDPWFARLPPAVRSAIRANAQRTPPRGYEDRLQRYFQNIE